MLGEKVTRLLGGFVPGVKLPASTWKKFLL